MSAPTKTEWIGYPVLEASANPYHVRLPNPSEPGDTIIIVGQFGSGSDVISSITDDKGNKGWVKDKIQANAGNGQSVCILRCSNPAPGTRVVTITFSAATPFCQFAPLCVNNIDNNAVDVTTGGNPTGTSLTAGSITPTSSGAFIVYVAAETGGGARTVPNGFTAHSGGTLFAPDNMNEFCAQYIPDVAGGTAINPALTVGTSFPASAVAAVAYRTKTSAARSGLAGGRVPFVQFANFNSSRGSPGTTFTINVPCPAGVNLLAFSYDDGGANFANPASNTSSSPANTWAATTPVGTGVKVGFVYAGDASVSKTMTLTITVGNAPTNTTNPFEIVIWGISGAEASPFEAVQSGSGTLNSVPPVTQNNVLGTALATAKPNEVILFYSQEVQQTVTDITSTVGQALPLLVDHGVYESLHSVHDAGIAHVYAATQGSYNFNISWSDYEGGLVVGDWVAQAIAFKVHPKQAYGEDLSLRGTAFNRLTNRHIGAH